VSLAFRLRHRFPSVQMDIAFEVPSPGITVLFGPSGSGKSTIIAAAAGLLRPDECRIAVDGAVLADTEAGVWLPPERRGVGLVFQDARLFPHMSVLTNLRFGMRRAAPGPVQFDEVVELLGIAPLLGRRPNTLSGGERQRVAIGRALLAQPKLLLMDEPLASLDPSRKAEILPFLARLKTALKLPVIYVTHALLLGRVAAHDPARALTRLDAGGGVVFVPLTDAPVGSACRIRIPAREVILAGRVPEAISVQNILPGHVARIAPEDAQHTVLVEISLPDGTLLSRVTPDAVGRLALTEGSPVLALVKSTAIEVLGP
jgi:molybdate transport system ATP-binding protein